MNEFEQEALDYFYEELESYYDEDEQGEIFDGFDDQQEGFLLLLNFLGGQFYETTYSFGMEYQSTIKK